MIYANIVLALLSLASKLFDYFMQQKWIEEGRKQEIARQAAEIVRKSGYAKQTLAEIEAMPAPAVDDLLHDLEPKPPDSK